MEGRRTTHRKWLAAILALVLSLAMMTGVSAEAAKKVTVSLADSTDYYIGTMVGASVAEAFKAAGADVDVLDAGSVISVQTQQIQNAVTMGSDIICVFPVGDASAYQDVLMDARAQGVKVMVSNNDPGEGAYDVYVGSEEFYMGAMMAKIVSNWIDQAIPRASKRCCWRRTSTKPWCTAAWACA